MEGRNGRMPQAKVVAGPAPQPIEAGLQLQRFEPVAQGTAEAPITLRAESPGGVTFRGNTKLAIGGHFLVVSGFRFDNTTFNFGSSTTTVSSILRHIRHGRVRAIYSIGDAEAEVMGYVRAATSRALASRDWPAGRR